jgi:predicted RNase H-like nuclease (RuvC/YqgF family)
MDNGKVEEIEQRIEEKVRTRIELVYIREEIVRLHKRIDDHMNMEEKERQQLMQKLDRLQWMVIASLVGLPMSEILQRIV